jgi:A/G-specific adenine glycosylase
LGWRRATAPDDARGGSDLDPSWRSAVRAGLLAWYRAGHRDLPWRRDRDPYRILVSEAMLVQTTVAAVIPYYERFLARFPTVEALAAAPEGEVLKLWEGLGYYRRARQLQAAARAIVDRHGGRVPSEVEALSALPGVGRYIAGAVASFAFDRPAPIVEANTQRVLARLIAWREPLTAAASRSRLWEAAGRLVPDAGAGEFNQALMELGAVVCTPRAPACLLCPIAGSCRARAAGLVDVIPARVPRPAPLEVAEVGAAVEHAGRWLFLRRAPGRLWEGFWEFPILHVAGADPAGRGAGVGADPAGWADGFAALTGVRVEIGAEIASARFGVTRHRVALALRAGRRIGGRARPGPTHDAASWVPPSGLDAFVMGAAMRRLARAVVAGRAVDP